MDNRIIKFRAWSNKDYEFVTDYDTGDYSAIEISGSSQKAIQLKLYDEIVDGEHNQYEATDDITDINLMQFTGLLDKEGTEIYEGDIIEYISKKTHIRHRDVVEYGELNKAGFQVDSPFINIFDSDSIEVIGNIYENPELLNT